MQIFFFMKGRFSYDPFFNLQENNQKWYHCIGEAHRRLGKIEHKRNNQKRFGVKRVPLSTTERLPIFYSCDRSTCKQNCGALESSI